MSSLWSKDNPNDIFSKCEEVCRSAGFNWIGCKPRKISWSDLVNSKMIEDYKNHLQDVIAESGCDTTITINGHILSNLLNLEKDDSFKENWHARVGLISGCAGSGKSTIIRRLCEDRFVELIVPNCNIRDNFMDCCLAKTPVESHLITTRMDDSKVIIVDEFTLFHTCEIMLVAMIRNVRNIICFGDFGQNLQIRNGSMGFSGIPVLGDSRQSHRVPKHSQWLVDKLNLNFTCVGKGLGTTEILDTDEMVPAGYKVLCLSNTTLEWVMNSGIEASLVSDNQGLQFEDVCVIINDDDVEHVSDLGMMTVCVSRHMRNLRILAEFNALSVINNGGVDKINAKYSKDVDSTRPFFE
uniref:(+)RNA virus helicase C-terminal domain-containing protein n=1 Tax=Mangifera indica latent virus TaxID=1814004 RepID=A0A142D7P8_9VIRU|nr:hypothetical protein [Mangifera indica latent virus]